MKTLTPSKIVNRTQICRRIFFRLFCGWYFYRNNILILWKASRNSFWVCSSSTPKVWPLHRGPLTWIPIHLLSRRCKAAASCLSEVPARIARAGWALNPWNKVPRNCFGSPNFRLVWAVWWALYLVWCLLLVGKVQEMLRWDEEDGLSRVLDLLPTDLKKLEVQFGTVDHSEALSTHLLCIHGGILGQVEVDIY